MCSGEEDRWRWVWLDTYKVCNEVMRVCNALISVCRCVNESVFHLFR